MKRIAITGIVILSVMFFGTCGAGLPDGVGDEVLYTNVEYSADMTQVKIYLDGTKVPARNVERAMTTDLAKMAYDYLEVVFINPGATKVARASWELGQSAGISGVDRDDTGVSYAIGTGTGAIMFVGKKSNKTLLGIGELIKVEGGTPDTDKIYLDTTSVTFELTAVKTGLCIFGESAGTSPAPEVSSFVLGGALSAANSSRTPLGNSNYPIYTLATTAGTTNAVYTFAGAAATYSSSIRVWENIVPKFVQRRIPRYMDGGRYFELKTSQDTNTTVTFNGYTTAADAAFVNAVPLTFTVSAKGGGAFSFYIEIPVYALAKDGGTNGIVKSEKWWLRTGLGSELYSIDDGYSTGGSVLMGVGVSSIDWIDIDWEWK